MPMCLKWMLCFEEPNERTLWLGKALPRDWLVPGEAPLLAQDLTTRYGRVSFSMEVTLAQLLTVHLTLWLSARWRPLALCMPCMSM